MLQRLLQHNGGALMSSLKQSETSASAAGAAAGATLERLREAQMEAAGEFTRLLKELEAAERSADMLLQRCALVRRQDHRSGDCKSSWQSCMRGRLERCR